MEIADLQALANRTRFMREASFAVLLGSIILALFYFVPISMQPAATLPAAAAAAPEVKDSYANVSLVAKSAIVYDLVKKEALYEKGADAQLPLASLTKLLTVYAAVATLGPESEVSVSAGAATAGAPRVFKAGETFKLSDLARLTLTASLNDGAAALAEATSERLQLSVPAMLAASAESLHLVSTYALNGNGLDQSAAVSGGYGSARDMAILAGALVERAPTIALSTTAPTARAASLAGKVHEVKNTNPNVVSAPRLLLSKTGFTDLAGGNLALVFDAGLGHPVAVVILGSTEKNRFTDAETLIAATLDHFSL